VRASSSASAVAGDSGSEQLATRDRGAEDEAHTPPLGRSSLDTGRLGLVYALMPGACRGLTTVVHGAGRVASRTSGGAPGGSS